MNTLEKLVLCTAIVLGPMSGCEKSAPEVAPEPIARISEVKAPAICASETRVDIATYGHYNANHLPLIYCKDKDQRDLVCVRKGSGNYGCYTLKK